MISSQNTETNQKSTGDIGTRKPRHCYRNLKGTDMYRYLLAIFLMTAGAASAQQLSISDRLSLRNNCRPDVQKLCPDAQPGNGGIFACLQENKSQLSESCSTTIENVLAKQEN
jgi:hypothetical protein